MATVTAWYTYADGDSVGATVETDTPLPRRTGRGRAHLRRHAA